MQNDILFDNIYIGHSVEDARPPGRDLDVKHPIEEAEDEAASRSQNTKPSSLWDLVFMDDPLSTFARNLNSSLAIAKRDPIEAIRFLPEVAGGIGAVVVTVLAIIIGLVGVGGSSPRSKAAAKAKDSAADAKRTRLLKLCLQVPRLAKAEVNSGPPDPVALQRSK